MLPYQTSFVWHISVSETAVSPHQTGTVSSKQMVLNGGSQDVVLGHSPCLESAEFQAKNVSVAECPEFVPILPGYMASPLRNGLNS